MALAECPHVDVNWQDSEGNTALITAAQAGKNFISPPQAAAVWAPGREPCSGHGVVRDGNGQEPHSGWVFGAAVETLCGTPGSPIREHKFEFWL